MIEKIYDKTDINSEVTFDIKVNGVRENTSGSNDVCYIVKHEL